MDRAIFDGPSSEHPKWSFFGPKHSTPSRVRGPDAASPSNSTVQAAGPVSDIREMTPKGFPSMAWATNFREEEDLKRCSFFSFKGYHVSVFLFIITYIYIYTHEVLACRPSLCYLLRIIGFDSLGFDARAPLTIIYR